MNTTHAKALDRRIQAAEALRSEREGMFRAVQEFCHPKSLYYKETQSSADNRERKLADSTAARSLELFASFLMSSVFVAGAAGQSTFTLAPASPDGDVDLDAAGRPEVRKWCDRAVKAIRHSLFSGAGSAVEALHNVCTDLGAYGTACLAVWDYSDRPGKKAVLGFQHFPIWNVSGEKDADGQVCAIYIRQDMAARAAVAKFPRLAEIVQPTDNATVTLCYAVLRADDLEIADLVPAKYLASDPAWVGIWMHKDSGEYLSVGSFKEQPIFLPAWYAVDNTVWGRSPAMTALGDTAMANSLSELINRGAEKLVDPPWLVRDGALLSPLRLYAGGISYSDGDKALEPLLPPGASRIEVGVDMLADRERRIKEAFFIHLFQDSNPTGSKQPRTVGEIMVQKDERNQAVSPMVLRIQNALLEPLIWRILGVLVRSGRLPPPPDLEAGTSFLVRHMSPVISSQMQMEAMAALRWVEAVVFLAQTDPNVLDVVSADEVAALMHSAGGVPEKLRRPRTEIDKRRRERAEREMQMNNAAMANAGGETAAKLLAATKTR